eukprot:7391617-Prymnesium_polylepis.3
MCDGVSGRSPGAARRDACVYKPCPPRGGERSSWGYAPRGAAGARAGRCCGLAHPRTQPPGTGHPGVVTGSGLSTHRRGGRGAGGEPVTGCTGVAGRLQGRTACTGGGLDAPRAERHDHDGLDGSRAGRGDVDGRWRDADAGYEALGPNRT